MDIPEPVLAYSDTFDAHYGLEAVEVTAEVVRGTIPVRDSVKQMLGLVHGGVYAAAAESLTSAGTFMGVRETGSVAIGMSNQTTFLRPISEGTIHVEGRPRHRGRTTWVWDVDVTDDSGRLCALVRTTIAVRELPGAGSG